MQKRIVSAAAAVALVAVALVAVPTTVAAQAAPTCNGVTATVVIADGDTATSGRDIIVGTPGIDTIKGFGGDDLICGLGGADVIDAGSGDDTVFGGGGHDTIEGGLGFDTLYGQPGADTIRGGAGNDRVLGGTGFDRLYGDAGNDFVQGSGGDDTLYGGDGNDSLYGKTGDDEMYGGDGDDELYAAGGNDRAEGGVGNDRIQGAGGNDSLFGNAGNDTLYGQAGADTMYGGDGDDELYGAAGSDDISGDAGDDLLQGAGGNDALAGGPGRDVLYGQAGSDLLNGGANTDTCYRGPGDTSNCEAPATNIAALEALWASARADIVQEITAAGYGVGADNVLRGPAGFEVDLDNCPAGWSNTAGVSNGTVRVSQTMAMSGSLGAYGQIGTGMETYFDHVNSTGGIGPDGLNIELQLYDDQYVATVAQEIVSSLVAANDSFWISSLGTPNTFAVRDQLDEACVPQPFAMSGHQAWGDPVGYPWTSGLQLSYAAEANLWVEWIEQNMAAPVDVSALIMDNDFGLAYEQAFELRADQSDVIRSVQFVRHDPATANLTNELATITANDPDVYISMTAGNPCLLAMQAAEASGLTESADVLFTPSVCSAISAYLAPAGAAADGWLIVGGGTKDATDSGDPFVAFMRERLQAAGLDPTISLQTTGFGQFGWAHVETLRIAAELPGGLTRTNYLLAMRSLDLFHPMLRDGVAFEMDGELDAYLIEGAGVYRFNAATQNWDTETAVIDISGELPNCSWQPGRGC